MFDPATMVWMDLSNASLGVPPSPRDSHGFTSLQGKLYVHGGWNGVEELGMHRCIMMTNS